VWQLGAASPRGFVSKDGDPWAEVAEAMDVDAPRLARLKQVHGTTVVTHRRGESAPGEGVQPEADIVVSDVSGLALAIQTADCVPILMADPRRGVVAAVHAGWRGLAEHAPVTAVERMARDFGTRAEDLIVAIGPAIASCCYEVGPDVRTRFERAAFAAGQLEAWFNSEPVASANNPAMATLPAVRRKDHWFFDAGRSARDQLISAGVQDGHVFVSGLCTASHPDVLCSYRRDGTPAGRMAAAIRPQHA
jgi:purine-nucleoside/S-methyl-5'-thioadenosine phosphorylase / adenosine deaminase